MNLPLELKTHHLLVLQCALAVGLMGATGLALAEQPDATAAAAASGPSVAASAPVAPPGPATRLRRSITSYTLQPDGRGVEEREWALAVLKPQALGRVRKSTVLYDPRVQKAEIILAYTLKADGRRIDAPLADAQPAPDKGEGYKALIVPFQEVEVGDTVVLAYRLTALAPLFPGQFSLFETLSRADAQDDLRIKIDVPAAWPVRHQAREMREVRNTEAGGRRVIEWAWENKQPKPQPKRADSVIQDVEQQPGLAFSTFPRYADIAQAYGARSRAAVTERVRKITDLIVQDAKAAKPRDIARALSQWVAVNIANTGTCLVPGAVVPRDLDQVLEDRGGDCKDHAALLQAMLSTQGIASTQALLNGGAVYRLPEVPTLAMVNHVINYIPSLDVFVDSTSEITPFGMLPFNDQDKPVFLVEGDKDGLKTPRAPIGFNQQTMKTVVSIRPDGSAKARVDVSLQGLFAVNARSRLRNLGPEQGLNLVRRFLETSGLRGHGTLIKDDGNEARASYGYRTRFDVEKLLPLPGAGRFTVAPLFFSESPIADYLGAATQEIDESADTTCASGRSVEEYRYELPRLMKVVSLPRNVKLEQGVFSYSATYQLKNQVLTVKRVFDDRTPGNVCTPDMAKAARRFAAQAVPDATAEVVFK